MLGAAVACAVTYFGVVLASSVVVALVTWGLTSVERTWQEYRPEGDQALDTPWAVLGFLAPGWWVLPACVLVSVAVIRGSRRWVRSEVAGIALGFGAALVPLAVAGAGVAYLLYLAAYGRV
jgi:hypothetical protein